MSDDADNDESTDEVTFVGAAYWAEHLTEAYDALLVAATGHHTIAASGVNARYAPSDTHGPGERTSRTEIRLTMSVEEAAEVLGISRAFAYEAIHRGEIPHVKIGRRILVPKAALERLIDPAAQDKA